MRKRNLVKPVSFRKKTVPLGKFQQRPFLTSSQLTDLFIRLDRNDDGELDLHEFSGIIRALQIPVSEDYVADIFRLVDTAASGSLNLQEFICAYQKIYANQPTGKANKKSSVVTQKSDEKVEFIRATRYGTDERGQQIFTLYTIEYRSGRAKGFRYNFLFDSYQSNHNVHNTSLNRSEKLEMLANNVSHSDGEMSGVSKIFRSVKKEDYVDGLEGIMKMVRNDSQLNVQFYESTQCRLLWWIDVALHRVERSTIGRYVDIFGLPNHSKFLSNFGNFGNVISRDEKSHLFVGDGVTLYGTVHSMSLFAQTAVLLNRPVLHLLPSVVDGGRMDSNILSPSTTNSIFSGILSFFVCCINIMLQTIKEYYRTRLAFVINFSHLSDTNEKEAMGSYEVASSIALRLRNESDNIEESRQERGEEGSDSDTDDRVKGIGMLQALKLNVVTPAPLTDQNLPPDEDFGIVGGEGAPLPLPTIRKYHSQPTWVASTGHLQKKPPLIQFDTLGIHVLDQGPGANGLMTIRKLDVVEKAKDKKSKTIAMLRARRGKGIIGKRKGVSIWSIEEQSRSGVIGRILDGVWMKLLENVFLDGVTDIAGELDDSPTTLACFITMLLHSFSMTNLGALDYWLNIVESDVKDIVVSKHASHVKEMRRIVKEMKNYVDPTTKLMSRIFLQWETESKQQTLIAAAKTLSRSASRRASREFQAEKFVAHVPIPGIALSESGPHRKPSHSLLPPPSLLDGHNNHRRSSLLVARMKTQPINFRKKSAIGDVDKIPLSFTILKRFFGDHAYRDLRMVLDGYETLDFKGLLYWQERLGFLEQKLDDVEIFIDSQIEEKRNFATFSMTIITTVLAPLTILTGWFGMNFDNMVELSSSTYESTPGVQLLWVIIGFTYIVMLCFAIHFRIIYSAT